jgi:hypothetical protein
VGDGARDGDDARVDAEAGGEEGEHVGGVGEGGGHLRVEGLEGGDGVGLRGGVSDFAEGVEGTGVAEKIAGRRVANRGVRMSETTDE